MSDHHEYEVEFRSVVTFDLDGKEMTQEEIIDCAAEYFADGLALVSIRIDGGQSYPLPVGVLASGGPLS